MAENTIEELIISLGLDASKLDTKAVDSAINSVRESVKGLDSDLKGVSNTLQIIGTQFSGFGKAVRTVKQPTSATGAASTNIPPVQVGTVKQPTSATGAASTNIPPVQVGAASTNIPPVQVGAASTNIPPVQVGTVKQPTSATGAASTNIPPVQVGAAVRTAMAVPDAKDETTKKEEKTWRHRMWLDAKEKMRIAKEEKESRKKGEKESRLPSSIGGLFAGMGLGYLAAGVYLVKAIFGAISGAVKGIIEQSKQSMLIQQAGKAIGLSSGNMASFRDSAISFGDSTGAILADVTKFGDEFVSVLPGKFSYGLQLMNIAAVNNRGEARKYSDVLNELSDQMAKLPKQNTAVYREFRQLFGFTNQFVDMMQLGAKGMKEYQTAMLAQGYTKPDFEVNREAKIGEAAALEWKAVVNGATEALYKVLEDIWEFAFVIHHPIDAMKAAWKDGELEKETLDWATNPLYGQKASAEASAVRPTTQITRSSSYVGAGGSGVNVEHISISVAIDKNNNVKSASVNGVSPRKITAASIPTGAMQQ